jgi:GMC oxidoreductase
LLRSGIGPAADIKHLGIDPIADLPVGENYMQQPASGVAHATTLEKGGGQSIKLLPDGLNGSIVPTNFSYGMPAFGRVRASPLCSR